MLSKEEFLILILGLLSDYGRHVVESRTKLMKIVFLLQEEKRDILRSIVGTGRPFRFEWYLFGPFSKEVLDYLDFLADKGLIEILSEDKDLYIQYNFKLTRKGRERLLGILRNMDEKIVNELKQYLNKFKYMNASQIKKLVYRRYLDKIL